jgi:hypothetical protein
MQSLILIRLVEQIQYTIILYRVILAGLGMDLIEKVIVMKMSELIGSRFVSGLI